MVFQQYHQRQLVEGSSPSYQPEQEKFNYHQRQLVDGSFPTLSNSLGLHEQFEFFGRAWPVVFQETREGAVCQEFAAGLAGRTVVGFV